MKYTLVLPEGLESFAKFLKEKTDTLENLFEEIYMRNLQTGAVSGITNRALQTRMSDPEANRGAEISEAVWGGNDKLILRYLIDPTYKKMSIALQPRTGRPVPTSQYVAELHFSNASRALGDRHAFAALPVNQQVQGLIRMSRECPLQIWSSDPSFYYQGMWEDLARIGGAAYRFPGPEGYDIWHNKHKKAGGLRNSDVRITKHLAQIINDFNRNAGFVVEQLRIL